MMSTKVEKFLIVSASIGSGHNQAAQALVSQLKSLHPMAQINVVDFMAGEDFYLTALVKETYLKMISISPNMYDVLYRWTKISRQGSNVQNLMARMMKRSMQRLIEQYNPDFIICTHPFPCGAAAYLKKAGKINIPLAGVITDFVVHRLWVHNQVDLYFVAEQEMLVELLDYGMSASRIHVTGIPIGIQFSKPIARDFIVGELGLDHHVPVVLVMGGGLGLGGVKQALRSLEDVILPLQLLVVTGHNDSLLSGLAEVADTSHHRVELIGYTERISELMMAADILVTKPGALTISEALAMGLPMLLYEPIPGQERDNAVYLVSKGAACWVKRSTQLSQALHDLFAQPGKIREMKSKGGLIAHPESATAVANIIGLYITTRHRLAAGI